MSNSKFVYTLYIAATAEKVWNALLDGEMTRQYWGHENVSDWKPGSPWQHVADDGKRTVRLVGEVVEIDPPRRLVLTWVDPVDAAEKTKHTRVSFDIEPVADTVRLTVTHDELSDDMFRKIANGWPRVLSSMKSFLETGKPLKTWA
jgi:uncharacterized protein YndB with AHSA1/START domain